MKWFLFHFLLLEYVAFCCVFNQARCSSSTNFIMTQFLHGDLGRTWVQSTRKSTVSARPNVLNFDTEVTNKLSSF